MDYPVLTGSIQDMPRGAGPSSGREAVNWDEQVVPALRKRESASTCSKRVSERSVDTLTLPSPQVNSDIQVSNPNQPTSLTECPQPRFLALMDSTTTLNIKAKHQH